MPRGVERALDPSVSSHRLVPVRARRLLLRALAAVAGAGALGLAAAGPAAAEPPFKVGADAVVDHAGVLDVAAAESAVEALYARTGIDLIVVFVDSFDAVNPIDWADETANLSGAIGQDDILLAVAVGDHEYGVSVDPDDPPFTDAQLDELDTKVLEPRLHEEDWNGAVADYAGAMGALATGGSVCGPGCESSGGGSAVGWIIGLVIVVAIAGAIVWAVVASRRRRRAAIANGSMAPAGMSAKELDRQAAQLLVGLDDAVKNGEEELGFAQAQFGDAAAADFGKALEEAKAKLKEAFSIQQQLDDATPEAADQHRAMSLRIVELCREAGGILDVQTKAFEALRAAAQNLPAAVAKLDADRAAAAARLPEARTAVAALASRYADAAVAPVKGNPDQAEQLLAFAAQRHDDAAKATATPETADDGAAALAVRDGQTALAQVGTLLAAIDDAGKALADASAKLQEASAEMTKDIAAAESLQADPAVAGSLPSALQAARSALAAVDPRSPVESIARLQQANAALDEVFAAVSGRQQQLDRARSQLSSALSAATAAVTSAQQFVSTRRGGIGAQARTRVTEADAQLQQAEALAASDPVAALAAAQRAQQLAQTAFDLAQQDVGGFGQGWPSGGGGGGSMAGSILGGILGGVIGSSMRGGGWSGGGWSTGGGFGGGGRRGGFGGGMGRPGSGGGHSRGGRF